MLDHRRPAHGAGNDVLVGNGCKVRERTVLHCSVAFETVQVASSTTTVPDPYVVFIPGCSESQCPATYTFTYRTGKHDVIR